MKCKCPYLIERYGYCNVKEDWVTEPTDNLSFDLNGDIPRK